MLTLNNEELKKVQVELKERNFNVKSASKEIMSIVKVNLLKENPWYGTFSFRINYKQIENEDFTVGVGWNGFTITMFYNPLFIVSVAKLSMPLMIMILQHEIEHIVRQHIFNATYFMPENIAKKYHPIWNVAGDALINHHLGMYVDGEKYSMVHKGENTIVNINNITTEIINIADKTIVDVFKLLMKNHKSQMDKGDSVKYILLQDLNNGSEEESDDNAIENTYLRRQILKGLCDITGRLAGSTPGHLKSYIDELSKAKIPFTKFLRSLLSRFYGSPKRTRMRTSRIIKVDNFVFPGNNIYGNNKIVLAIDTSGSIEKELFSRFMSELDKASEQLSINFCTFDYGIQQYGVYKKGMWRKISHSQGGTSFPILIEWLKKKHWLQYPVFVLSDGESNYPNIMKNDVFWCLTRDTKPPFGIYVPIE